jgi:hypothetical protein
MNFKAYLAGILTGALCTLCGYIISHANVAMADPGTSSGTGFVLATSDGVGNDKDVYILDATDSSKPRLSVYAYDGRTLQFRSHRNLTYDKSFDHYEFGGEPQTPTQVKAKYDKEKPLPPK